MKNRPKWPWQARRPKAKSAHGSGVIAKCFMPGKNDHGHLSNHGTQIAINTLAAYVLTVTLTLRDENLLLVNESFSLPILSLQVSLIGFFLIAPALLVLFHIKVLAGLAASAVHNVATDSHHLAIQKVYLGLKYAAGYYIVPVTIAAILWRIADYQSTGITIYHALLLLLDIALIRLSRRRPRRQSTRRENSFIPLCRKSLEGVFLLGLSLKLAVCWDVFMRPWKDSCTRYHVLEKGRFIDDDGIVGDIFGLIPNLVVDRTTYLLNVDQQQLAIKSSLLGEENWDTYFLDRGVSIDLRNRSLRLAYLHGQLLPRMWAHNADFQGANLSFSLLSGAVLVGANLQDTNLELTDLSGAYLDGTIFRNAFLKHSIFRGASLERAQFQQAYSFQSNFVAAWAPRAQFEHATILGGDFSGAYLEGACFEGTIYIGRSQTVLTPLDVLEDSAATPSIVNYCEEGKLDGRTQLTEASGMHMPFSTFESDSDSATALIGEFCSYEPTPALISALALTINIHALTRHPAMSEFAERAVSDPNCSRLIESIGRRRTIALHGMLDRKPEEESEFPSGNH